MSIGGLLHIITPRKKAAELIQIVVKNHESGLSYLSVLEERGHAVQGKQSRNGLFVEKISGLKPRPDTYYGFKANGRWITTSIDLYRVRTGDRLTASLYTELQILSGMPKRRTSERS